MQYWYIEKYWKPLSGKRSSNSLHNTVSLLLECYEKAYAWVWFGNITCSEVLIWGQSDIEEK
jgi:hypothetical protein